MSLSPQMKKALRILERHEIQPYEVALIHWENEEINYALGEYVNFFFCLFILLFTVWQIFFPPKISSSSRGNTKLERGNFILSDQTAQQEAVLERFAFSNALCLSGKPSLILCLVICFLPRTFAFSCSEAGNLGSGIRQLCGVNSINTRGTVGL